MLVSDTRVAEIVCPEYRVLEPRGCPHQYASVRSSTTKKFGGIANAQTRNRSESSSHLKDLATAFRCPLQRKQHDTSALIFCISQSKIRSRSDLRQDSQTIRINKIQKVLCLFGDNWLL